MYTLNISGHKVSVTPEIKDHVKKTMSRLSRYSDRITSINVTFTTQKNNTHQIIADAKIHIPGNDLVATAQADSQMENAVDALANKLERQLRKQKTKQVNKQYKKINNDISEERKLQDEFNALADRGAEEFFGRTA